MNQSLLIEWNSKCSHSSSSCLWSAAELNTKGAICIDSDGFTAF